MAETFQVHPTDDPIFNILINIDGIIGDYVNDFPGVSRLDIEPKWLENWYMKRIKYYFDTPTRSPVDEIDIDVLLADIINQQISIVKKPAVISSIWPHYFRGFRHVTQPINLTGKLVVIDGSNSSGKTSLAEAFEWLFSGSLVRRSLFDMGDSKELENCITNQLRPDNEQTWVEARFLTSEAEELIVRRVLIQDYSDKKSSVATSQLYLNDLPLSRQQEEQFLDELLAGIPPVLMQHSLRAFVLSTPAQRRDYFERLLKLDELAHIIEKSVIGDARLIEFPSLLGSVSWKAMEDFKTRVSPENKRILRKAEQSNIELLNINIESALVVVAQNEFEISDLELTIEEIKRLIEGEQKENRERNFPLLETLRPSKVIDQQLMIMFSGKTISQIIQDIVDIFPALVSAKSAAEKIGDADLAVSKALDDLAKVGFVSISEEPQICPLCDYRDIPTLLPKRIQTINSWLPVQQASNLAQEKLNIGLNKLLEIIQELEIYKVSLMPVSPEYNAWKTALDNSSDIVKKAADACQRTLHNCTMATSDFNKYCTSVKATVVGGLKDNGDLEKLLLETERLIKSCSIVIDKSHEYNDAFLILDNVVGGQAREDPVYNLKEIWMSLSQNLDNLVTDLTWEKAKKFAQSELEKIRDFLLLIRQKIIGTRRVAFNNGMTAIWGKLRSDRYSSFSRLYIPEPKGRGLPLEIHVKAELDDGQQKKEVDALRVFSESQINILGLAAFATRSKMLGHKFIILDDPVQSMDEEHFKTFVNQLLPELLGEDGQVIVFTHNDTFARELSYAWADKEVDFYITMSIEHRRKQGCIVEEGNRRVHERLERAEKYADNGDLDNAWIAVRRSIERFYTLIRIKHGATGFDHLSWRNSTGEDMWKQGVGSIFESKGLDTKKLREILSMTAAAAHDKKPYGKTDLLNSTQYIRELAENLKIVG